MPHLCFAIQTARNVTVIVMLVAVAQRNVNRVRTAQAIE